MNYDRILIRYGEMSLKGKNRKHFVNKLKKSIKTVLVEFENISIISEWDRMYVLLNGHPIQSVTEALKNVFGIQSFSPAIKAEKNIEAIREAALHIIQRVHEPGQTFKISARRQDKAFEYDTHGLNHAVGAHILIHTEDIKVDVKNPDTNIIVEVRYDAVYVSGEIIKGAGGFPAGSSGKAMLMLSGGIDSPVAGYLTMKRGVELEAIHFHSPPFTNERAKQKVIDLANKLAQYSGKVRVHLVPFTEIQETIHREIPDAYTMTATRRMMLQIADEIRERRNGLAIVTGESLGQVASQTMESMMTINAVTSTPMLRPLITMDKNEIIDVAKKIDTLEISNRPYEDCCTIFTPPAPATKPRLDKMEMFESKFEWQELLDQAIENTEAVMVYAKGSKDETDDLF